MVHRKFPQCLLRAVAGVSLPGHHAFQARGGAQGGRDDLAAGRFDRAFAEVFHNP